MRPVLTKTAWTLMPSYSAVYLELDSGRHDAGLMDAINGKGFVTARQGKNWIFVQPTPALATDTNIALKKSNPTELLRWLNLTVNYLKQRGELKAAWDKYTN
jgi:ABC-type amino acid transport substrate-binding protein